MNERKRAQKFTFLLLLGLLTTMMLMPMSVNAAAKLNKKSAKIYIGKTVKLKVTGKKGKVKWSSANPSIASVSSSGTVKGKKAGKTTITAKAGSKKLKCTVQVKKALIVDKKSITVNGVGNTAKIKVNFLPTGTVYYHIDNSDIVSAKWGKPEGFPDYITVTGKSTGTTNIKVYSNFNKEAYNISVTVKGTGNTARSPFDTFAYELKNSGIYYQGTYNIAKVLGSGINMLVEYDEDKGTIRFSETIKSSTNGIIQMTLYRNSDRCYLYATFWGNGTALEYERTTTRSQIRNQGYITFSYTDTMKNLGLSSPSYREQKSVNELFNLFLKGCSYTIPGTYSNGRIYTTMSDLFPNF